MAYIGNQPSTVAFLTNSFSGNGSTTAFTLSVAPATTSSILVAVSGVLQDPSTYTVSGTTLTFTGAPPSGSSNISVRFLGIPASGVSVTSGNTTTNGLYEHSNTIVANYTIATNNNALSGGPITVASGVTVTVPSGSAWTVV
jgi:hypothetical protein